MEKKEEKLMKRIQKQCQRNRNNGEKFTKCSDNFFLKKSNKKNFPKASQRKMIGKRASKNIFVNVTLKIKFKGFFFRISFVSEESFRTLPTQYGEVLDSFWYQFQIRVQFFDSKFVLYYRMLLQYWAIFQSIKVQFFFVAYFL